MSALMLMASVELLLLVLVHRKIKQNKQLIQEIRSCHFDLASALWLASQQRFHEAHGAARKWHVRLTALREGRPPPQPERRTDRFNGRCMH
jgi:hypothetical protein